MNVIDKIFKRDKIDKKKRIQEWIDWVSIPVEIVPKVWGEERNWVGQYDHKNKIIRISEDQSDKEIIKSIIHEVSHWKNDDRVSDPDIWIREERAKKQEKDWKKKPEEVIWI